MHVPLRVGTLLHSCCIHCEAMCHLNAAEVVTSTSTSTKGLHRGLAPAQLTSPSGPRAGACPSAPSSWNTRTMTTVSPHIPLHSTATLNSDWSITFQVCTLSSSNGTHIHLSFSSSESICYTFNMNNNMFACCRTRINNTR